MRRRGASLVSVVFVVVVAAVYVVLALLGKVPSPVKDLGGSLSGTSALSGDALYAELDSLLTSPDRKSDLGGKFTFTAYIATEPEEVTFDDEKDVVHQYQEGWISRNEQHYFLLDVKDLPEPLETRKFYTVTGTLDGSVYWTEDNKKISVLAIVAVSVEEFAPKEPSDEGSAINGGPSYVTDDGVYTFKGAHKSSYHFGDTIVVYFDFENTGSSDAAPSLYDMTFYQGDADERASAVVFEPDNVDPKALPATKAGVTEKTYAGKTQRYYAAFAYDENEAGSVIYLLRTNDNFELVDDIGIQIANSYANWLG